MRWLPALVLAFLLAGCTAGAVDPPPAAPRTHTWIVVAEDVLLGPTPSFVRIPYWLGTPASSAVFMIEAMGTATSIDLELPASCERASLKGPGPTGSMSSSIGCPGVPEGDGELVIAVADGMVQGRVVLAVTYLV